MIWRPLWLPAVPKQKLGQLNRRIGKPWRSSSDPELIRQADLDLSVVKIQEQGEGDGRSSCGRTGALSHPAASPPLRRREYPFELEALSNRRNAQCAEP